MKWHKISGINEGEIDGGFQLIHAEYAELAVGGARGKDAYHRSAAVKRTG